MFSTPSAGLARSEPGGYRSASDVKPARPWVVLLATLTIQALVAMALLTLPVVAPVVARSVGVPTTWVGGFVGVVYSAAMLASLLGGGAVRRWGALRLSQVGLACSTIGLCLCAIPHPVVMFIGAIFVGLGYGPITPASSHLLIKTTPPSQLSLVFSVKQTGVPLGGMIAGALVPSLDALIGWQLSFLAAGLMCALCAWAVQPLRAALDSDRDPTVRPSLVTSLVQPLRLVFSHKRLRTMVVISFLFAIFQLSLATYLVTFLYEDLGWSLIFAGVALTVTQAAGVGGRILWGFISDRWLGPIPMLLVITVLMAIGALGCAMLTSDTSLWLLFPILIVFGSTAIGWNGVFLAEVARLAPPGQAGLATGGSLCITFLGIVAGPSLFGIMAGLVNSYGLSYGLLTLLAVGILVPLWRLRKHDQAGSI
ncbi:MAG: MFS transporter [Burkholderiales bacterium]